MILRPPPPDPEHHPPPLLVSPDRAAEMLGISRTSAYELIASGRLPSGKVGRRRLVHVDDIAAFARQVTGGAP